MRNLKSFSCGAGLSTQYVHSKGEENHLDLYRIKTVGFS